MPESIRSNAAALAAVLENMSAVLDEPAPILERARALIAAQEVDVWATEGGILGEHWPAAAESSGKGDSRLLVATGALRASMTSQADSKVSGNTLTLTTNVPYAGYHQSGTGRMPARPFLGIAPTVARAMLELVAERVNASLEGV